MISHKYRKSKRSKSTELGDQQHSNTAAILLPLYRSITGSYRQNINDVDIDVVPPAPLQVSQVRINRPMNKTQPQLQACEKVPPSREVTIEPSESTPPRDPIRTCNLLSASCEFEAHHNHSMHHTALFMHATVQPSHHSARGTPGCTDPQRQGDEPARAVLQAPLTIEDAIARRASSAAPLCRDQRGWVERMAGGPEAIVWSSRDDADVMLGSPAQSPSPLPTLAHPSTLASTSRLASRSQHVRQWVSSALLTSRYGSMVYLCFSHVSRPQPYPYAALTTQ
ncbi:uncharacterized protein BDZ99DRAFT_478574 [Mytilinidion resinicola]|uniref:Uncharacterized protein n=1 Tax=Mytilinidion resinicola TaxID=574789 RepID=A0A6A6YJE2_9PEZI|nr:uncharacterized protein BDZ99DRAFT_478574 [Mytilinidion resinicola]KAF2808075.1 hypothetical protein BDZ99DRAFT_478574 [Mytilinidion resinicola]